MLTCFSAASVFCPHFWSNPETNVSSASCGFYHTLLDTLPLEMLPLGLVSVEICLWGRQVFLPKVNHQGSLPLCEVTQGHGVGREWPPSPGKLTRSMPVQPCTLNPGQKQTDRVTSSPGIKHATSQAPGPGHLLVRKGRWEGEAEDSPGPPQGETGGAVAQSKGWGAVLAMSTRCHSHSTEQGSPTARI